MQPFIHYFLHFGATLFIAFFFFRKDWKYVYGLFVLTMLVDLDHLFADPIFQPNRCSVGFHYLHTGYAMIGYFCLLLLPRTYRIIGVGLLFHMLTDFIDCMMMYSKCSSCYIDAPAYQALKTVGDWIGL